MQKKVTEKKEPKLFYHMTLDISVELFDRVKKIQVIAVKKGRPKPTYQEILTAGVGDYELMFNVK